MPKAQGLAMKIHKKGGLFCGRRLANSFGIQLCVVPKDLLSSGFLRGPNQSRPGPTKPQPGPTDILVEFSVPYPITKGSKLERYSNVASVEKTPVRYSNYLL